MIDREFCATDHGNWTKMIAYQNKAENGRFKTLRGFTQQLYKPSTEEPPGARS